jgi:hypothetical protein
VAPNFSSLLTAGLKKKDVIDGCRKTVMPFTFHENTRSMRLLRGAIGREGTDGASTDGDDGCFTTPECGFT